MSNNPQMTISQSASEKIYHNLIRLMVYLHSGLDPAKAWRGLPKEPSFTQFKTLTMLRHLGPCTIKQLAESLGISAASASEMVDRLVELDLIDRRQDPADRRRVQLNLTNKAFKGVQRHEMLIYRRLDELIGQLSPESVEKWKDLSTNLSAVFEELQSPDAK